jgi:hypothetical protein
VLRSATTKNSIEVKMPMFINQAERVKNKYPNRRLSGVSKRFAVREIKILLLTLDRKAVIWPG